jgi:hypothetical protein
MKVIQMGHWLPLHLYCDAPLEGQVERGIQPVWLIDLNFHMLPLCLTLRYWQTKVERIPGYLGSTQVKGKEIKTRAAGRINPNQANPMHFFLPTLRRV